MMPLQLLLSLCFSVLWPFTSSLTAPDSSHVTLFPLDSAKKFTVDHHGAIIRGDVSKKEIAIVLTGDEFGDGAAVIRETFRANKIRAAFFLTGNFYSNPAFKKNILHLKKDGHYLGAHSDKHLLYVDWLNRDSLLVSEQQFKKDLLANYDRMSSFDIKSRDARFFLPPYEWYNADIARWTKQLDLQLINFSPGTRSAADYTYPEMGERYIPSDEILNSILEYEQKDPHGLNGFILLIHIGADPRRKDKFYYKLGDLIAQLKQRQYTFVGIDELLE
jgi:endoglucanase